MFPYNLMSDYAGNSKQPSWYMSMIRDPIDRVSLPLRCVALSSRACLPACHVPHTFPVPHVIHICTAFDAFGTVQQRASLFRTAGTPFPCASLSTLYPTRGS